jgi:hypothetical protein
MYFRNILLISLLIFTGYNKSILAQFGTMPPFTVEIEAVITAPLPALHSFAFAQSGDKWLIIGGRTNGLHGLNSSGGFPSEYKNDAVIVIDTNTWAYYSADLNQLSKALADPMRSSNMQYIQEGNYLYMVGGYGYDSVASIFVSFPKLTAVHVDDMINAVINSQPIAPAIRQVADTNLSICGGELGKIGSDYYLIFGHNFGGRYTDPPTPLFTQTYSDKIKKFNLTDDGTTITLSGFTYQTDTNNFHRRDLNVGPIVYPDNSFGLGAYAGVFRKDSNLPYREPIRISATGTTINASYHQVMNQYTCALMPVYDSITQKMYTTFFGGISMYNYNDTTGILSLDNDVPFIDDITTMTVDASGAIEETILPVKLPALLGSNAKFVPTKHVSSYSNEVIRIRDLPNTKILAGYFFGGIRAQQGNFGSSSANDTVYRVYITPNNTTSIEEGVASIQNLQLFPNPSNQSTTLLFTLKQHSPVTISLFDVTGKKVLDIADEEMQKGNQKININTSRLSAGVYICKIQSDFNERLLKLVVGR